MQPRCSHLFPAKTWLHRGYNVAAPWLHPLADLRLISSPPQAGFKGASFEGNFVTALPSFIDQHPAEEYLQTIEKSELLRISRADFYHLVDTLPGFTRIYTEILELGFIVAQKRIYGFQGFDAMQKVRWIIQNQPQILVRVSNTIIRYVIEIELNSQFKIRLVAIIYVGF